MLLSEIKFFVIFWRVVIVFFVVVVGFEEGFFIFYELFCFLGSQKYECKVVFDLFEVIFDSYMSYGFF